MEKYSKLAALGAAGVAVGTFALYLLLIAIPFYPTLTGGAVGATGGIDHVHWQLLVSSMFVPVAILSGLHLALAKQLKDGPQPMHH
jgi:hypothetical protein